MAKQVNLANKKRVSVSEKQLEIILSKYCFHKTTKDTKRKSSSPEKTANGILKFLIGSNRTIRKGPIPPLVVQQIIKKNLIRKIAQKKPILVSLAWGCTKTTACYYYKGVDIAELLAIEHLIKIYKVIKSIYVPGLKYSISLHDSWWKYIYDNNIEEVNNYCHGIETILETLAQNFIKSSRLSEVIRASKKRQLIASTKKEYTKIFENYWYESESEPEKKWPQLDTFKKLTHIGWKGTLPQIMRDYYLKKADRLMPECSYSEKISALCRYFAFGLTMDRFDLAKRKLSDIDFSFISPPPGAPRTCINNRLFIRSMPPGTTKKQNPPWTGIGIIKYPQLKPSIITDKENEAHILIQKTSFTVSGGKKSITLPVNVYKRKKH
jgi:hypothetical protein